MFLVPTGRWIALLLPALALNSSAAWASQAAQPAVVDMRDATLDAVKQRAASAKPRGLTLLFSGPEEKMDDIVREVAAQCAADNHPVMRVILASQTAEGVTLLDTAGEPIGALISPTADLRGETHARVALIADPLDVIHCRVAPKTGSNLRRQKVCSTPREDAAHERSATEWTRKRQDGAMTEPAPGH